jgi:hypothetical protein
MTAHDARSAGDLERSVVARQGMHPQLYDEVVAVRTRTYEEDFAVLMPTLPGRIHVLGGAPGGS